VAKPKQGVWLSPLDSSFHRFPGAQIFIYKRLLISSSRKALRWRDSRNSQRGPCVSDTQLDSLKAWCPRRWTKLNAMRNRGYCEVAVERAHTKSLDANDKLIKNRSHVRDTTASRKRQVIMRKVKSTILPPISITMLATCLNALPSIAVNGLMSVDQNATAAFKTLSLALCGTDPSTQKINNFLLRFICCFIQLAR